MCKTEYIEIRGLTSNAYECSAFLLPEPVQEKFFRTEDFLKKDVIFVSEDKNFNLLKFDEDTFLGYLLEDSYANVYTIPVKDMVLENFAVKVLYRVSEGIFNVKEHCWYIKDKKGKLKLIMDDKGKIKSRGAAHYFELNGKSYFSEDYLYCGYICKVHHPLLPKEGVLTAMKPYRVINAIEKSDKFCIDWEDVCE